MTTAMTPPPTRKLTRSTRDSKIAGVSGGLGEYFGIDPVIFRLAFVVATFAGGSGLLAYIIAWLVLPESDGSEEPIPVEARRWSPPVVIGALLIVAGVVTLVDSSSWFGLDLNGPALFWPIGLLVAGGFLIFREREDARTDDTTAAAEPTTAPSSATGSSPVLGTDIEPFAGSMAPYAGSDIPDADLAESADTGEAPTWSDPPVAAPQPTKRRFSPTRLALGALLMFFGIVGLAYLFDWFAISITATLAIALVITGGGLVAGAIWGGGWPLVPLGILLGLMVTASAAVGEIDISGGTGENVVRPASGAEELVYDWGIGHLQIDLRDLSNADAIAATTDLEADLGIGELEIIVPEDMGIVVDAESGIGAIDIELPSENFFINDGGFGHDESFERVADGEPVINITADVGIGRIFIHEG